MQNRNEDKAKRTDLQDFKSKMPSLSSKVKSAEQRTEIGPKVNAESLPQQDGAQLVPHEMACHATGTVK
jgi:hypothetical protein